MALQDRTELCLPKYGPMAKPIPKNTPYIDTCLPILLGSDVVVIHVCVPTCST